MLVQKRQEPSHKESGVRPNQGDLVARGEHCQSLLEQLDAAIGGPGLARPERHPEQAARFTQQRQKRVMRRTAPLLRAGKTPQKVVQRATIILLAASGMSNNRIAKAVKTTRPTVLMWRARFEQFGCSGLLKDLPRPGRKPMLSDEKVQEVIELT